MLIDTTAVAIQEHRERHPERYANAPVAAAPTKATSLLAATTAALSKPALAAPAPKPIAPAKSKPALTPSNLIVPSKDDASIPITEAEYGGLQKAYEHFNNELFDGKLPNVAILLQRKAHSAGHFGANRLVYRTDGRGEHELSLNPDAFVGESDEQACQTLVHEQCHVLQHCFGTPPSRGYHDRQWCTMMKAIGLQPSSTGKPGGRETGSKMADYIIADGPFTKAFARLAASGWRLNLESARRPATKASNASKTKFTCPGCGSNMWGKANSQDACPECDLRRVPETTADAA